MIVEEDDEDEKGVDGAGVNVEPPGAGRAGVAVAAEDENEDADDEEDDASPLCHSASRTSSDEISVSVGGTISGNGCGPANCKHRKKYEGK
jgi:hypothetical protein